MSTSLNAGQTTHDELASVDEGAADDRSRMSFLEHLDEFRRRLIYSVYALVASCAVTLFYWDRLFKYYVEYLHANGGTLVYNQPMGGFMFSMKVSLLAGVIVASPFMFSQFWLFVAPGLYAKEKRVVVPFVIFASLFFFGGAYFAHRVAFPGMVTFFASYQMYGLNYFPNLDDIFGLYVKVILGMGLVFQMPMLVFFLARFGVITAAFMIKQFKYAILIIFIVAAVITPTSDPVNLMIFAGPMCGLYLLSIGVAWLFGKKKKDSTAGA